MEWKTVYIIGRKGFFEEVIKNLDKSDITFMSGYQNTDSHELVWIPEAMTIREFKEAIGAKTVFRYRLQFFVSLEGFIKTLHSDELTEEDKNKIERMRLTDRAA